MQELQRAIGRGIAVGVSIVVTAATLGMLNGMSELRCMALAASLATLGLTCSIAVGWCA